MIAAMKQDLSALEYASTELLQDADFFWEAVEINPRAFTFASEVLRTDRSFVDEAVRRNGLVLTYATDGEHMDRALVNKATATRLGSCSGIPWVIDALEAKELPESATSHEEISET